MSFGGTRTYHRMVCAIEDAGFEIRDCIQWIYGSGFPKSMDISKAIDKKFGAEREVVGQRISQGGRTGKNPFQSEDNNFNNDGKHIDITLPSTDEAKQWNGWGTALKPAAECWWLIRKPLSEKTIADNILKWGNGGINIDDCRIPSSENLGRNNNARTSGISYVIQKTDKYIDNSNGLGRFPANVIFDEEAGKMLDKKSGIRPSGKGNGNAEIGENSNGSIQTMRRGKLISRNDSGGASRFFYCAKSSKSERGEGNFHPTVKPLKLIEYLITLVTPLNGICLDPFEGSGTHAIACEKLSFKYIGFEKEKEYFDIAEARIKHDTKQQKTSILYRGD